MCAHRCVDVFHMALAVALLATGCTSELVHRRDGAADGRLPTDRGSFERSVEQGPQHDAVADAAPIDGARHDAASTVCSPIPGVSYGQLSTNQTSSEDPALHVDVNLLLRKTQSVAATLGLVAINGPTDTTPPPQLHTLFADERVPTFSHVYQVEQWDWGCKCFTGYIADPEVTLAGLLTQPGEVLRAPHSGYDIGGGRTALVLYAAPGTITLKYTREDNVVSGYTVHLSGICIEPSLQALYDQVHAAGRQDLPALSSRQPFGRALGSEIQVAIRDTGAWMDPRSKKDWWQGK